MRFMLAVSSVLLLGAVAAPADLIALYEFSDTTTVATASAPDVTADNFAVAAGMDELFQNFGPTPDWPMFLSRPWDTSIPLDTSYFEIGLTGDDLVGLDYTAVTITNISFTHAGSASGPTGFSVRVSTGGSFMEVGADAISTGGTLLDESFVLSTTPSDSVTFRIYANGATQASGVWRIDNVLVEGFTTVLTVPEPAAASMMLVALMALAFARRRRSARPSCRTVHE